MLSPEFYVRGGVSFEQKGAETVAGRSRSQQATTKTSGTAHKQPLEAGGDSLF